MHCEGPVHRYAPKTRLCYCQRQQTPKAKFKHLGDDKTRIKYSRNTPHWKTHEELILADLRRSGKRP